MSAQGRTPRFIYLRVYQDIKSRIECGRLKSGERLPSEKKLQETYGASRDTIRKALSKLEQEDYLSRKVAKGTFVKFKKNDYKLANMTSFTEQMLARGLRPSSEILSIELTSEIDRQVSKELGLEEGSTEKVYIIHRIRKADEEPMALEIAYIPYALCPDIHTKLYNDSSLYNIYENEYHLEMDYARISLESDTADAYIHKHLKIDKQTTFLKMQCTMWLKGGRPLYHVKCFYLGDKYIFTIDLPR